MSAGTPSTLFRDAALVVGKDLRLEWRSRVITSQVLPFAVLVLVLFAFALDPDRRILGEATPGLFWLAVLFSTLLALQRAFAVEAADGVTDALRLSGLDPAGIFLGKAAGIAVHLLALELVLGVGVTFFYGTTPHGPVLLVATCLAATAGLAAVGSLYGVLSAGMRARDTLLPLLLLPVVAPVLIAATQAFAAAYDRSSGEGWRWFGLLVVFALLYLAIGIFAFETLLEES
ncbi:heme exporter protein CcmB [Aquihabitans sp. G128]|uniref:heme exporter protein CcmB n=1 Tax=Aquihabitans sp. G128 TaxID=2849779 RepID=UPI001C248AB8|nr:heme exporter protein CcmB [Aquihabitans sp. G128]QXC60945.1 heme exporter protein CcmB [Aquihabitans sp. G128]